MKYENFHAHIYFESEQKSLVETLAKQVKDKFDLEYGTIWNKPVGPHSIGSCQISFSKDEFKDLVFWLMENRGELSIFIHVNTGDDLVDHTRRVLWLGRSYELNLSIFE